MRKQVRFLCDEMLARLARWLRAAGYDTTTAPNGARDNALLRVAIAEERILLTCDRKILEHRNADRCVLLIKAKGTSGAARELSEKVAIDWCSRAFTRCLEDNTPLEHARSHHNEQIPPRARALGGATAHCPTCDRVYWPGSHYRRMLRRLEELNRISQMSRDHGSFTVRATRE